jgi:hypothetical protein
MLLGLAILSSLAAATARADDFDKTIAPILARRCLGCHNRTEKKGGLDLSTPKSAAIGGDSGAAFVAGKPDDSLLWERIAQEEMPPKQPLPEVEKRTLREWIAGGATWGTDPIDVFRFTSDSRAGYDWWSLQTIRRPVPPRVKNEQRASGAIDRFVLAELEAKGLEPAPPADKRTLIRRVSFDLLGLPPDPAEVERFLTDQSPGAYASLIERMLESPHYGERWGRHWLDVVRFGESQGFERDKLRPFSWPYRDWVIAAFNDDLPYDEFVRLQLAGDVLRPHDPRAVTATGFLVAGPWDEVGQSQQSAAMKMVVRQDELEDLIGATCQTFLGLTVNCARCHDHKFDPISQTEYYRIAADFAGVRHGERERLSAEGQPQLAEQVTALRSHLNDLERQLDQIDGPVRDRLLAERRSRPIPIVAKVEPVARWEFATDLRDTVGELHGTAHGKARIEEGRLILDGPESYVETSPLATNLTEKTLEVWLTLSRLDQQGGGAISVESSSGAVFDAVVYGEREPGQWMAGSNNFTRTQSFQAPPETEAVATPVQIVVVYGADRSVTAYRNGQPYGQPYVTSTTALFEAGKSHVLFGLRHSPAGGNRHLSGAIERAALFSRALSADEVASLAGAVTERVTDDQLLAAMPLDAQKRRWQLTLAISHLRTRLQLVSAGKTYAVVPGTPEPTWELERGNPHQKGERVTPGGIRSLSAVSANFGLTMDAGEPERRIKLAEWITDPKNPLTARVIVNRLWHYHFGSGLVETPNDFGFNGGRPSHPALLDWLAAELMSPSPPLRKGGLGGSLESATGDDSARNATPPRPPFLRGGETRAWSLKHIHRLIVSSTTYRQASRANQAAIKVDAGNRLLWRRNPQRLEAEAVRDSILQIAGAINPQMGGPGFQDFRTYTFNSQFYEMLDPIGYEFQRRTVYRTWVRSGRNEFLDVFDCPDPSTTSPRRAVTTTPLQALAMLNNSFALRMSERLAERLEKEAGAEIDRQVRRLYDLAYSRAPTADEMREAQEFVSAHSLAHFCRVVFNSNEFLYVD